MNRTLLGLCVSRRRRNRTRYRGLLLRRGGRAASSIRGTAGNHYDRDDSYEGQYFVCYVFHSWSLDRLLVVSYGVKPDPHSKKVVPNY